MVTGIIIVNAGNNTDVAFKNCALFSACKTDTNDLFIDEANHIYISRLIYNLIEYSDNYSDTSGSLWDFKRDQPPANNVEFENNNHKSKSFEYEAALVGKASNAAGGNGFVKSTKIVVPLIFGRSLEMPLINRKIHREFSWIEDRILSSADDSAKFKITDAKLHVPTVALSTKYNVNLTKIFELLSASFQGIKMVFVLAYVIARNAVSDNCIKDNRKYFLPRAEIKNCNVLIDRRNFYYQPINDLIKQYDEVRKVSIDQGDDYTT